MCPTACCLAAPLPVCCFVSCPSSDVCQGSWAWNDLSRGLALWPNDSRHPNSALFDLWMALPPAGDLSLESRVTPDPWHDKPLRILPEVETMIILLDFLSLEKMDQGFKTQPGHQQLPASSPSSESQSHCLPAVLISLCACVLSWPPCGSVF
jgi:hypothetical protein